MRQLLPLLAIALAACAQTSEPIDTAVPHEPTVQMTVVSTTLSNWPYSGPITFAIPDDMMYSKEQGKPWLPLLKQAISQRMQQLGLTPAAATQADVIVMGTHGRRGVRRLMLGSVAEGLIRVSNRPVLLVRDK